MGYRPLAYFWIVELEDGTTIAQFDSETGEERKFPSEREAEIRRFMWCPFSPEFAEKVCSANGLSIILNECEEPFVVNIKKGQKFRWCRRNRIRTTLSQDTLEVLEQQHLETTYIMGTDEEGFLFVDESGGYVFSKKFNPEE